MTAETDRIKALRSIVAEVTKGAKLEPGDLILGADIRDKQMPRTSTGILALDVALNGGIPLNQWTEVVGHESAGKTALTMQIVAAQQAMDPEWVGLWVAAEGFEGEFARMHGIDTDRLIIADLNSMEEAFETVIRTLESKAIDGVVIDSYPALVPTGEYESDMDKDNAMAIGARLMGKFFRKVQKASRRSLLEEERPWLGIIINQWRDRVGLVFGDPRTTPGGKNKNYAMYTRLEVKRDSFIDNGMKGQDKVVVGQTIDVKVFKNKGGPPERRAAFDFYFTDYDGFRAGEVDFVKDIFLTANALGVLEREKNTYYFLGEPIGGNQPAALRNIEADESLAEKIQSEVFAIVTRKSEPEVLHEPPPPAVRKKKVVKRK